jgi:hypothetical protein
MKKVIIIIALISSYSSIIAQTEFEALKYTQTEINGTARYMGMAGAFGALGGDASSIKDNPAGLGIYRRSEIAGGLNFSAQSTDSKWNQQNSSMSNPFKTKFNNFSFIISTPTWRQESGTGGLLSSNFSFTYNRLKDFNRSLNMKSGLSESSITDYIANYSQGYTTKQLGDNINVLFDDPGIAALSIYGFQGYLIDSLSADSWMSAINQKITPAYRLTEKGHLDEYSFGWAGNFNNVFYLGATVNIKSLNYTGMSTYSESFGSQGNMQLGDTTYTKGTGVSLNIGAIVRPTDFLRLGLAIQTPAVFSIDEEYYSTLEYKRTDINKHGTIVGNSDNKSYQLQSPTKIDASAAYIIGTKALISVEYDYSFNSSLKYINNNNGYDYSDENAGMKNVANNSRTVKIGGEYKLTDNFSLRAGFANTNNSTKPDAEKFLSGTSKRVDTEYFTTNKTNYYTAGFGYREANWFLDFAYVHKELDEIFNPYKAAQPNTQNSANLTTKTNNILVTLGFKF